MTSQIPLNAAASDGNNDRQVTNTLPPEVVQCLENARFLHLATCTADTPNVSLMNYTYLPSSPHSPRAPVIIMTTNPASKKMTNLVSNPNVSLLVHDWVSHRPPTTNSRRLSGGGPSVSPNRSSSLASLLLNLNTSAMSSISATINGAARVVAAGTDEEKFYRRAHLDNNTFDPETGGFNPFGQPGGGAGAGAGGGQPGAAEDGGRGCFVAGEEVRVIVVEIRDVRISDWKGNVRDWVLVGPAAGAGQEALVNGAT